MQDNNLKILNYLNGELSEAERFQVEQRLAESDENRQAFERMQNLYELSYEQFDDFVPNVDRAWEKVEAKTFAKKTPVRIIYKIVALITLIVGLGYLVFDTQSKEQPFIIITSVDEIKQVGLVDGTTVWLNKNSKLSYPEQFSASERVVSLKGQAFFEVAKNPAKPFIVEGGATTVEVLGTSFDLIATGGYSNVNVVSGKVSFSLSDDQEKKVILSKGGQAIFKSNLLKVEKTFNENASSWMTKDFVFKSTPLTEVTEVLGEYFKVIFEVDRTIQNCLITSSFEDKELDEILDVLRLIANIKSNTKGNTITLTGPSC